MKRFVFALLMIIIFLIINSRNLIGQENSEILVNQQNEEQEKEFNKQRLWGIGLMPLLFVSQTVIHELSHAAAIKLSGGEVSSIKFFVKKDESRFYFGLTYFEGKFSNTEKALIVVVPYLYDISIFTISDQLLLRKFVNTNSYSGFLVYSAGMLAPLIDFSANYWAYALNSSGDFYDFSKNAGIDRKVLLSVGVITIALAGWRCYERFVDVMFKEKTRESKSDFAIIPFIFGSGGLGIYARLNFE